VQKIEGRQLDCPACGAPLTVESAFTRTVVCTFCGQGLSLDDKGLNPTGRMARLSQAPSIFSIGRTGKVKGRKFKVLGRLRYDYEDGYWDEWFLKFEDGQAGWVTEEEGECALFFKELITAPMELDAVRVGKSIFINNRPVFITEVQEASLAGGEGELNYRMVPGTSVRHIEGNASGTLVSVEVWPKEIEIHAGHPLEYNQISMD
jgi:hypothetical protein